jgi:TM2 domain-containing membrane protein YozV
MNCYLHPDTAAVAFCRSCGRPLCTVCQQPAEGTVFCVDHVPVWNNPANPPFANPAFTDAPFTNTPPDPMNNAAASAANPYFQPASASPVVDPASTSPALAFLLGWIPGVGAIYNGQYMKGLVHAIVFGLLITLISNSDGSGQPLFVIVLAAFVFYMPFEALHTAKKRRMGVPVDEWSSLVARNRYSSRTPVGPVVLIILGVFFLLDTLRIIEFRELARYWPVLLIVVGAFMLYNRITGIAGTAPSVPPPRPPFTEPPYPSSTNPAFHNEDVMEPRHEQ